MKNLSQDQQHKASQILGFVNLTLRNLPDKDVNGVEEMEATYIIQAAMFREKDNKVIDYCNKKFKEWYSYVA